MKYKTLLSSLLLSAGLSFSAQATDFINLGEFPQWFQDAMAREGKLSGTSQIEIASLGLKQEVPGQYTMIESESGNWTYQIEIGSDFPATCYVFTEYDGYATSLYSIIDFSLSSVEASNNKKLSSRFNYAIKTGVVANTPYLGLDTLYSLGEGEDKISGVLKAMVAESANSLQVCVHNEVGFRQTFYNTFSSFVQAFINSEQNDHFFEAVYKMSFNNIDMGFARETYSKDAEGDINIINTSAMLMPVDASSVSRSDTVTNAWSRPDGSIINAQEYTIENGVVTSNFALSYADDAWQVSGELQGKEINTALKHDGWLLSGYGSYSALRDLRSSDLTSADYHMWTPSADPTSAIPITLRTIKDNPIANFEIDMGIMAIKFLADERAIFQNMDIAQGPITINMKLIYSNGEPIVK